MSRSRCIVLAFLCLAACGKNDKNPVISATECSSYCTQVVQHCFNNASDIDLNPTSCPATCARFPTNGKDGDTTGDTVQCRLYHSGTPAAGDPATHCPHAGVSGANTCGLWCDVYCREARNNCTDGNQIYANDQVCATACAGLTTTGTPGATTGNTVQCRIYHLNAAATDPNTHCPHGKVESTACVDAT